MSWRTAVVMVAIAAGPLVGCGGGDSATPASTASASDATSAGPPTTPGAPSTTVGSGGRCVVRLHGKGGAGADTVVEDGVSFISPTGNADGWGARQWIYFPDADYDAARAIVAEAITPCERVILDGFSNGAAFAAKLYCRGETFDGRLLRVVVDDPVPDHGVDGCAPDPTVDVALYWTGGLEPTAQPGWDCSTADWTCEGGSTIGIEAYAAALGADAQESPFDDHQWYLDAPEVTAW